MKGLNPKAGAAAVLAVVLAYASQFQPSPSGLEQIKAHEGRELTAYLDAVQVPTICYGSTANVRLGQVATPGECDELLRRDATYAGLAIQRGVHVRLSQQQYDALTSFVFNVGETKFRRSTMLRYLNSGQCYAAAAEFDKWVFAKGRKLRGLVTRRADERRMFEAHCAFWSPQ